MGRKNNFYHRVFHDRVQAKLDQVSLVSAGVYANFRNYAGAGFFDGSLWYKSIERMTVKDCTAWIARKLGGEQWQDQVPAAKLILKELRDVTLLTWGRDSVVQVVDFASEQYQAPTPGAQRTRDWRARRDDGNPDAGAVAQQAEDEGSDPAGSQPGDGVPPLNAPAPIPPPTSPATTSTPTPTGAKAPPTGFGFGYRDREESSVTRDATLISKSKSEIEKRDYRPSNSTGLRPHDAGEVGGGIGGRADIYAMQPVDAATYLTGERGQYAINGFNAALRRVGREEFMATLGEFRQALADGIRPRTTAGAMFHGILRTRENRNSP